MSSFVPGDGTPWLEVTNVSQQGVWLLVDNREFFLPYENYPQFREASVGKIFNVMRKGQDNFYWPDLSLEIDMDTLFRLDETLATMNA